jgi:predicted nucleic acid-binding protein
LNAYADASFLVSLYSLDANSLHAAREIERLNPTVLLTPLVELELENALELRIFRREATPAQVRASQAEIRKHIEDGFFSLQPMPATVCERARQITRRRTAQLGLRTLDILHVASALLLHTDAFLTFDRRQLELARRQGLRAP